MFTIVLLYIAHLLPIDNVIGAEHGSILQQDAHQLRRERAHARARTKSYLLCACHGTLVERHISALERSKASTDEMSSGVFFQTYRQHRNEGIDVTALHHDCSA